MPVDTRIDGDPESIRSVGRWLRSDLARSVDDRVTEVNHLRTASEAYWQADSGTAFRASATRGARNADELAHDADRVGQSFEVYADDLHTALAGMGRARQIALDGGLVVTDTHILEPGPVPIAPTGTVTASTHQQYTAAVQSHARQVATFQDTNSEAIRARDIVNRAVGAVRAVWNDLQGKKYFNATDLVNGVIGELAHKHVSVLRAESARVLGESKLARARYLKAPGGSVDAKFYTEMEFAKTNLAGELERGAASVERRVLSKVPIIGLGIAAAGIGYDIATGKPPGKAIISGVGGATVAIVLGGLVGGPIGAGALAGIAFGTLAGVGLDAAYDALPQGVKNKIEGGVNAVGHAANDAANAIGHEAKKVWDSIF
ncbi:MAG TPA: hypothetical protein VIS06_12955 [Mycobacteriales bacterium]